MNLERTLTSNEVAEMIGKEHSRLLKDIRIYIKYLGEGKIDSSDFFIKSTYKSEQNKDLPNYLLTKQGCEKEFSLQLSMLVDSIKWKHRLKILNQDSQPTQWKF